MKIYSLGAVSIAALFVVGGMIHADADDSDQNRAKKKRYDYIVVGGGAAGCIVARKLSDNFRTSVLLLEAGGNYVNDPVTLNPNWLDNVGDLLVDPKYSINYPLFFPPLTTATYSEGHELGGGAAHNFLLVVRGTPSIYNGWAATTGNSNWLYYSNVLNLMKALETYTPDGTVANLAERGLRGPIAVTQNPPLTPVPGDYLSSLSTVTLTPFVADYNDPASGDIGISAVQQFITPGANSRRSFSAYEFLSPVIDANGHGLCGRKLTVVTNANALDFRINNDMRATSVHYTVRNNEKHENEYEVVKASLTKNSGILVLSAGSVQTSKLLLQSGVGPAAELQAIGIPVVLDSPNVGQNLQCQYGGSAIATGNVPFEAEAFIDGYPYMANDGVRRIQIIHSPLDPAPSFQAFPAFIRGKVAVENNSYFVNDDASCMDTTKQPATIFQALPLITNPASRGSVTITSNNPFLQPKVQIGLFNDGSVSTPGTDAYLQVSFYKIFKSAVTAAGGTVIYPTPVQYAGGDAALLAAAQSQMVIQSHIVGTTRMGTDISNGVIDGNLKVFGLENVYDADNGAQPESGNGNTCYPAYIIAQVLCQVLGVPTPPAL